MDKTIQEPVLFSHVSVRETSTSLVRLFTTKSGANHIIVDRDLVVFWNRIITILDNWNVEDFNYVCHSDVNPFTLNESFQGGRGHKLHIIVEFSYLISVYLSYFKLQHGVPISIRYAATLVS